MTDEVRLGEIRLVAVRVTESCDGTPLEGEWVGGWIPAWQDAITEEEYQAADDWIGGKRPIAGMLRNGSLLDRFRRKGRAAFNPEGEQG